MMTSRNTLRLFPQIFRIDSKASSRIATKVDRTWDWSSTRYLNISSIFQYTPYEGGRIVSGPPKRIIKNTLGGNSSGRDFGQYEIVFPREVSEIRTVPDSVAKPDYHISGYEAAMYSKDEPEIKNEEQIKKLRASCALARDVLTSILKEAKEGVTTEELDKYFHELVISLGAYPSCLNYGGYPKSICTSVNNVACHGIPDNRPLRDGDIINIDIMVYSNGYHGDCSETVLIGNVDPPGKELVETAKACLYEGIRTCAPGVPFSTIGKAIESLANEKGFTVVPAFTGHGIGNYVHGPPDIYHIDYPYPGIMKPGNAFTIEPVLTQGGQDVVILEDGWTAVTLDEARTAQFEHTVLITESGVEILTLPS